MLTYVILGVMIGGICEERKGGTTADNSMEPSFWDHVDVVECGIVKR